MRDGGGRCQILGKCLPIHTLLGRIVSLDFGGL
jgi:hypothetical protein